MSDALLGCGWINPVKMALEKSSRYSDACSTALQGKFMELLSVENLHLPESLRRIDIGQATGWLLWSPILYRVSKIDQVHRYSKSKERTD